MVKELIKKCILCKHGKFALISKQVRDSKKHKIIRCLKCNHTQLWPIPTLNGSIKRARRKMMPDNTRRAELVSKIITKRSRILEIGSGHGFFLDIMKKNGYDITGFEISKEKRKYSKKVTKVPVLDININEKIPTNKSFDIVVLFHTLEHIIDPVILLKNIKKLLKPKGKVLVEVPNCDDFHLGLNKFYKEFYWERAHIHYFNPKSLKTMINLGGFKSIKITGVQRYSIENFFHWRLKNKPQMENPTYSLSGKLNWLDESYKKYLERNLICDTLISIANI